MRSLLLRGKSVVGIGLTRESRVVFCMNKINGINFKCTNKSLCTSSSTSMHDALKDNVVGIREISQVEFRNKVIDKDAVKIYEEAKLELESQGIRIDNSNLHGKSDKAEVVDKLLNEMVSELRSNGDFDVEFCSELLEDVQVICKHFTSISPSTQKILIDLVSITLNSMSDSEKIFDGNYTGKVAILVRNMIRIGACVGNIAPEFVYSNKENSELSLYDNIFKEMVLNHNPITNPAGLILAGQFGIDIRTIKLLPSFLSEFSSLLEKRCKYIEGISVKQFNSFLYGLFIVGYRCNSLPKPLLPAIDSYIEANLSTICSNNDDCMILLTMLGCLELSKNGLSIVTSEALLKDNYVNELVKEIITTNNSTINSDSISNNNSNNNSNNCNSNSYDKCLLIDKLSTLCNNLSSSNQYKERISKSYNVVKV